jgi:hypothetical protein
MNDKTPAERMRGAAVALRSMLNPEIKGYAGDSDWVQGLVVQASRDAARRRRGDMGLSGHVLSDRRTRTWGRRLGLPFARAMIRSGWGEGVVWTEDGRCEHWKFSPVTGELVFIDKPSHWSSCPGRSDYHPEWSAQVMHVVGCPLARPWLYNLVEDLKCTCADLVADGDGRDM